MTQTWVVVGGGVLGMGAARAAARVGHEVLLLEAAPGLGGLAAAHRIATPTGAVTVDRFYHVVLKSDRRALAWLAELGLADAIRWRRVRSTYVSGGRAHPASSAAELARLPLPVLVKARIGLSIAVGAALPAGAAFSGHTAHRWLRVVAGRSATRDFWEPLLAAKLGPYARVAGADFLRSTFRRLALARFQGGDGDLFGVVPGGYARVLDAAAAQLEALGVQVRTGALVDGIVSDGVSDPTVRWRDAQGEHERRVDRVVVTTPAPVAARLLPGLSAHERDRLEQVPYLGVLNATALLRQAPDPAYLTYVVDDTALTSVIGMHALVPPDETAGCALVHLPRYTAPDDPLFEAPDDKVWQVLFAGLQAVYPQVRPDDVVGWAVGRARHVMPVPVVGYRDRAPSFATSLPGVWTIGSAQLVDGTLNVESSLALLEDALPGVLEPRAAAVAA